VFGGDTSVDSLRIVDHRDPSKELRHWVILVQAGALVQCNGDCSIAVERVTAGVLVCSCAPLLKGGSPVLLYFKGRTRTLQWDLYSTR
jgi:hypothetical protein